MESSTSFRSPFPYYPIRVGENIMSENDEEEMTFVVELSGILDSDLLNKVKGNCKVLVNTTDRIENGNRESVKETTTQPKSRKQLKAANGSSMQLENPAPGEASQLKETKQNILHHLLGEESINTSVDLEFSHVVNKKLVMKRAFLTSEDEIEEGESTTTVNQDGDYNKSQDEDETEIPKGPDG